MVSTPQGPFSSGRRIAFPTPPRGEQVASFDTYEAAQTAVDTLAHSDFPLQGSAIVGNDMKSFERVTGRLSWGRAAGAGAISGLWLGLFLGILLSLSPTASAAVFPGALLLGAAFGVLFGLASYAITRRRRDFSSVMQVIASSYSLVVDPQHANRARNLLNGSGGGDTGGGGTPIAIQAQPAPATDGNPMSPPLA